MDTHGSIEGIGAAGTSLRDAWRAPWGVIPVNEFSITAGAKYAGPQRLHHRGRFAMPVPADRVEAQYRFPDGSTLLLASRNRQFAESLSLLYLGADLVARDHLVVGGAYTPGYLAYAEIHGPASIAFCWHDQEQVVTIHPRRHWFGLGTRWLTLANREPG